MTREGWDVIQSLGGYAEVSRSMTGAHVFVKGRTPSDVDGRKIMEDLEREWARRDLRLSGQRSGDRNDLAAHRGHAETHCS
jgi:hypothetical protein